MKAKTWAMLAVLLVSMTAHSCEQPTPEITTGRQLDQEVAWEVWVRHGFRCNGTGGGRSSEDPSKIGSLTYGFEVMQRMDRAEARALMINTVETVLEVINQTAYAEGRIANYPCSVDQLWIWIDSVQTDGTPAEHPDIQYVSCHSGKIKYKT